MKKPPVKNKKREQFVERLSAIQEKIPHGPSYCTWPRVYEE